MNLLPKISIVTPNFNGAQFLEKTIKSVVMQGYPNLEYIIIDGGSTDGSVEIIKKYEKYLAYWITEKDKGLYDAIQKGFQKSTGDIMAWINSDDIYISNSFFVVSEIMRLPNVNWIQGLPAFLDEADRIVGVSNHRRWSKFEFWEGDYQWIQQESTFWKRSLWDKAGGFVSAQYKYAGDLELWNRFFLHDNLNTPYCILAAFRMRSKNQLSLDHMSDYMKEAEQILAANKHDAITTEKIKTLSKLYSRKKFTAKNRFFNFSLFNLDLDLRINALKEYPPAIHFDRTLQKFTR